MTLEPAEDAGWTQQNEASGPWSCSEPPVAVGTLVPQRQTLLSLLGSPVTSFPGQVPCTGSCVLQTATELPLLPRDL